MVIFHNDLECEIFDFGVQLVYYSGLIDQLWNYVLLIPQETKLESTMGSRANLFVSGQCHEQFIIHMNFQVCFGAIGRMLELSQDKQTRVLIKLDH